MQDFNPNKMYTSAIIGLGNIGFLFDLDQKRGKTWSHASAYNKCLRTSLDAVVEIDPEKIKLFSAYYPHIPIYGDLEEMLTKYHIDIVSLCTPTESHYEIFNKIASFPVRAIFCEKPFAQNAEQCKSLWESALDKDIVTAVNHTRRWDSCYANAVKYIAEGRIGNISTTHSYYPGQIYNIGTHLYDTIRMLIGKNPTTLCGLFSENDPLDPSISGMMMFDDIFCTVSATGKHEDLIFEIDIIGDQGRLKILNNGNKLELYKFIESQRYSGYRELEEIPGIDYGSNDRLLHAVYDIVNVLDGKKKQVACSAEDGYWSVVIAESFFESACANGKIVTLNKGNS